MHGGGRELSTSKHRHRELSERAQHAYRVLWVSGVLQQAGSIMPHPASAPFPPLTHSGNGGAFFIQSGSAALTNCSFTQNDAMYGGAIAMESSAALYSGGWGWGGVG